MLVSAISFGTLVYLSSPRCESSRSRDISIEICHDQIFPRVLAFFYPMLLPVQFVFFLSSLDETFRTYRRSLFVHSRFAGFANSSFPYVFLVRERFPPTYFTLPPHRRLSVCTPARSPSLFASSLPPCFSNLPEIVFFLPPRSALPSVPCLPDRLPPAASGFTRRFASPRRARPF